MTISANKVFARLEDMADQLAKSWPTTMQSIVDHPNVKNKDDVFIYTFTKWDHSGENPTYKVWHQVRQTLPDPFWGTVCRKLWPKEGKSEIIWCLPHKEGQNNYKPGKVFGDEFIWECIKKKKSGELDRMVDEFNESLKV